MEIIVKNNFDKSEHDENKKQRVKVFQYPSNTITFIEAGAAEPIPFDTDDYLAISIDPDTGRDESRYILYNKDFDGDIGYVWRFWIPFSPHDGPFCDDSNGRRVDISKIFGLPKFQQHWSLVIVRDKPPRHYKPFPTPTKESNDSLITVDPKNVEVGDENQEPEI